MSMLHRTIDDPDSFALLAEMGDLSKNTDAKFSTETSEVCDTKAVLETPQGGLLILFADKDDDSSYFTLQMNDDYMRITLSEISGIEFDVRPEDDQFRVITSGDTMVDFGL